MGRTIEEILAAAEKKELELSEENKKEVTLTTSKGHYLDIGNVIQLNTPNHPEISGKHRIKAKSIKAGGTDMLCTLTLNKESPRVGDYI